MIYIGIHPLAATFTENVERLATISSNKSMPRVMWPFAIVGVKPNTLTVDERGINNMVLVDRATFSPGNERPTTASKPFLIEKEPSTEDCISWQNTQTEPLNKLSFESSHMKAQEMTFTTKFAGTGIQQQMTLWNPQNNYWNTLYIDAGRKRYAAIKEERSYSTQNNR